MSVSPARRAYAPNLPVAYTPAKNGQSVLASQTETTEMELLDGARVSPMEWARRRRAERDARRVEAASHRAIHRLEHLGPAWRIVPWPRTDAPVQHLSTDQPIRAERAGFLAIGPGGVFAVTVADHGRSRVLLAGDVVQINGKRPPYVPDARREAKLAARALSKAVGHPVPVVPVLTFVGSGEISVHGLPNDCLVATDRELDRLLVSGGPRISPATAEKLSAVARHPTTWLNSPYRSAVDYRWYAAGSTATDKRASHR